ncbi:MAG: SPFH/Band 7/PHB domain protein [Symploca sp. SIO2E9]|nr:SPFH/Band 7/PHB domain protein [Symploca sp. SIO2E9]
MDPILSILVPMVLVAVGYTVGAARIINQGNEALVERLGKKHRKLDAGLNFVVPVIDRIAVEESTRERVLDTKPRQAITKDNVSVSIDAVVFWKIVDLDKAYYNVEDVEDAMKNLVLTRLRSLIGEMELDATYSSMDYMNRTLLEHVAEATADWGVQVVRVEVQEIEVPESVRESLEKKRIAESEKQAAIERAEGEKEAEISKAEGTVKSLQLISTALREQSNSKDVLQYLIAQRYVEANEKLGESDNSKVVFMDPARLSEAVTDLLGDPESPISGQSHGNGSIRPQDQ